MTKPLIVRKSIRLPEYDYAIPGYYFVTVCVADMKCLLGRILNHGNISELVEELNAENNLFIPYDIGKCLNDTIQSASRGNVLIDKYVIMPNHFHMIVILGDTKEDKNYTRLGEVVRRIKSYVSKQYGKPLWQKGYYEHIIRTDEDYLKIWQYIDNNPLEWTLDKYYKSDNL